jgi:hypothetical protein
VGFSNLLQRCLDFSDCLALNILDFLQSSTNNA